MKYNIAGGMVRQEPAWGTAANWEQNKTPTAGSSNVIIPSGLIKLPNICRDKLYNQEMENTLSLSPGSKATFSTLTNSGGTPKHLSDATGIASLIFNSYSDSWNRTL